MHRVGVCRPSDLSRSFLLIPTPVQSFFYHVLSRSVLASKPIGSIQKVWFPLPLLNNGIFLSGEALLFLLAAWSSINSIKLMLGVGGVVTGWCLQQGNRQIKRHAPRCMLRHPHTMITKRLDGHSGCHHADDSKDTRNQCA